MAQLPGLGNKEASGNVSGTWPYCRIWGGTSIPRVLEVFLQFCHQNWYLFCTLLPCKLHLQLSPGKVETDPAGLDSALWEETILRCPDKPSWKTEYSKLIFKFWWERVQNSGGEVWREVPPPKRPASLSDPEFLAIVLTLLEKGLGWSKVPELEISRTFC